MGFGVYRNSTPVPVYDEGDGFGWAGVSAGAGTIALAAGGIPVVKEFNSNDFTTEPLSIPVIVKPSDSDSSYMLVGVRVPNGGMLGIRDLWVTYWEED